MKKIVVVYDIDNTLFDRKNDGDERVWIGSRQMWLDLCFRLKNVALKYDVELNFAIATAKDGVDCLVEEVALTFSEYLFAIDTKTHLQMPVNNHGYLQIHYEGKPGVAELFSSYDEVIHDPESTTISSIQVAYANKSPSLKKIAEMFDVADYSNIYLVDDSPGMLNEASNAGFSVISAEKVCVPGRETTNQNAINLIADIERTITSKIINMKPPCQSLFFTKPPELTPLQKTLGAKIIENNGSRRYFLH